MEIKAIVDIPRGLAAVCAEENSRYHSDNIQTIWGGGDEPATWCAATDGRMLAVAKTCGQMVEQEATMAMTALVPSFMVGKDRRTRGQTVEIGESECRNPQQHLYGELATEPLPPTYKVMPEIKAKELQSGKCVAVALNANLLAKLAAVIAPSDHRVTLICRTGKDHNKPIVILGQGSDKAGVLMPLATDDIDRRLTNYSNLRTEYTAACAAAKA